MKHPATMNIIFGVPFWDHWFDWGASIMGSSGYTLSLTRTLQQES